MDELTPTERAGKLTYLLMTRNGMTAQEISIALDVGLSCAYRMTEKLERVLPIEAVPTPRPTGGGSVLVFRLMKREGE